MRATEAEDAQKSRLPLLLIQDYPPAQLDAMTSLLRRFGYDVRTASSGRGGLESAMTNPPVLIVCSATMPDMDGPDLCRSIRSASALRTIPILLVSGLRLDSPSVLECLRSGADDYLGMPYSPRTLLSKVDRLVERRRAGRPPQRKEPAHALTLPETARDIPQKSLAAVWEISAPKPVDSISTQPQLRPQDADRLLQLVLNDVRTMVFRYRVRPEITCEYMSPSALGVTGYAPSQFYQDIGLPWNIVHPEDRRVAEQALRGSLREPMRFRIVRKDGVVAWIELRFAVDSESAGMTTAVEGTARDITEFKRMEEKLSQLWRLEAYGRLAGKVAHDFNNLLTVMLGHSSLALEAVRRDNPLHRHLEGISFAVDQATLLTRQLLQYSHGRTWTSAALNLNSIISDMKGMLGRLVGDDVELVLQLSPYIGEVRVDPGQAVQAILNLTVHARDEMPGGGRLVLTTSACRLDKDDASGLGLTPGVYTSLIVSGKGTGMDANMKAQILDSSPGSRDSAFAPGLVTVCEIIKSCGGGISVESNPGTGTTIRIVLPLTVDPHEEPEVLRPIARRYARTGTVLVVEDDDLVRDVACVALESEGYRTMEARTASEAIDIYSTFFQTIDLVLIDLLLPDGHGEDLGRKIDAMGHGTALLYTSGFMDAEMAALRDAAPIAFIEKPFTLGSLAERVRLLLDPQSEDRP